MAFGLSLRVGCGGGYDITAYRVPTRGRVQRSLFAFDKFEEG